MLTANELRAYLHYDPETGVFTRQSRVVGYLDEGANGYIRIRIKGKQYLAHRLAWLYVFGQWPENEIDHINGIKIDNHITNLRSATHSQNQAYSGLMKNNTSGYKGVFWHKQSRKWEAHIRINGKSVTLCRSHNIEEARKAFEAATIAARGEFARFT